MRVEVNLLLEVAVQPVEVGEHVERSFAPLLGLLEKVAHDGVRVNLLLDVDRNDRDGQVLAVLVVLTLPHKLRVERRVTGIKHRLRRPLIIGHEVAKLLRRDVRPLLFVPDGVDFLLGH